jgi:hypothetical protein
MTLGDPRAQTFDTINMTSYRMRDLPMTRAPLVDGFAEMSPEERDKVSLSIGMGQVEWSGTIWKRCNRKMHIRPHEWLVRHSL